MAMEILDKANANYNSKRGSEKYNSNLPEIQAMIASAYKGIESYNYVTNGNIMPDLTNYGTYYDNIAFSNFEKILNEQNVNTQTVSMVR